MSKGGKDVPGYYTKAGDWVETRGYDPRPQRALGKDPLTGYQQIINKMTGERKTLGAPGLNPNQRKRIDAQFKTLSGNAVSEYERGLFRRSQSVQRYARPRYERQSPVYRGLKDVLS